MSRHHHVVLSRPFDLEGFDARAKADLCPRHLMSALRDALAAEVHEPGHTPVGALDRLRGKVPGVGTPDTWAMTRELAGRLGPDDLVFTIAEDTGFPLAVQSQAGARGPRLCVFVHHPERLRVRYMFRRYRLVRRVDRFITNTEYKAAYLRDRLGVPADRVYCIDEQTDTRFFTPGAQTPGKARPVIGSGGLESRDYVTLAAATGDMDVDVRVCAVSPNATKLADTFPETLPDNMKVDHYDWQALRQLYRDADVVVVSLKEHSYQAGLTTLFEAMACNRPVVMTRTAGLVDAFAEKGLLTPVPPRDPVAMRAAIDSLLNDPNAARAQAERGYDAVLQNHNSERYLADLIDQIAKC